MTTSAFRAQLDKAIEGVDTGCSIKLLRGDEWVMLWLDRDSDSVVWSYGRGSVGQGRSLAPRPVLRSQIEAHCTKGWVLDPGFYG
jgi:hypothetical protein